jgi:hypothetical protein
MDMGYGVLGHGILGYGVGLVLQRVQNAVISMQFPGRHGGLGAHCGSKASTAIGAHNEDGVDTPSRAAARHMSEGFETLWRARDFEDRRSGSVEFDQWGLRGCARASMVAIMMPCGPAVYLFQIKAQRLGDQSADLTDALHDMDQREEQQ